ncbi:unnamed protein product [Candidula unifasciata]|uniref:G-protein coupled receptors family 1 profile domain-containing protein n=1 Tax=Candidula unifasciata TaxID=100452 RepID=A0A8S3ZHU6_9EUPU|nr:unnamed protein product [Candidula unifasciata]
MANNTTESAEDESIRSTADAVDRVSVWFCLATGIPGNLFIFLTVRSFPCSVTTFHYQLLSVMDTTALILQVTIRGVDWYDFATISSSYVGYGWKVYFNVAYFTSIYANWVLVYIATERLIALRYPSQIHIYVTISRAKANAILTAILIASFCVIVIVKMDYFAIAWLVVFTTFYTAFPLGIVFMIIWLLLGTMEERRRQKKVSEKEKEKHPHHHHHHHHKDKDGHKASSAGHTPTDTDNHTSASSQTTTISKSTSGLSKQSGGASKHGPAKSASHNTMVLSFTTSSKKSENSTPEVDPEAQEILTIKAQEKKDMERCYTSMMLALSVAFVLLTVPYTVIEYIYVAANREITDIFDEKHTKMYLLVMIALCLMYFEHSCNFYIFFLCSWKFRQQFLRVITRKPTSDVQDSVTDIEQSKSFV